MFDLKYATAKMIIVYLHTRFSRSWVNVGSKNYIIADSAQAEYCTTLHSMECGLWGAKIRQNDWIFGPYLVLNCNNNEGNRAEIWFAYLIFVHIGITAVRRHCTDWYEIWALREPVKNVLADFAC